MAVLFEPTHGKDVGTMIIRSTCGRLLVRHNILKE